MTKQLLDKLPEAVMRTVEAYRKMYADAERERAVLAREIVRGRMAGYAQGLRDAGLITERERQTLFIYMTV